MKKIIICSLIIFFISCFYISNASNDINANMDIIESQKDTLNIGAFIKEANKYTKDVFSDIEVEELLNSAIKGDIQNGKIIKNIWKIFGSEIINSISVIGSVIIIVIIHSIIKSISDGLENKSISKITYYVQYNDEFFGYFVDG